MTRKPPAKHRDFSTMSASELRAFLADWQAAVDCERRRDERRERRNRWTQPREAA
jgi:hypothetical protein